mgnify:CR=1 FL=1
MGVLHFVDRPLFKAVVQLAIALILAHFRMDDVLVNCGQLTGKQSVQRVNQFGPPS